MPILGSGAGSRTNLSGAVVLNNQPACVPVQRPTCNRLFEPQSPNLVPAPDLAIVNNANTITWHVGDGVHRVQKIAGTAGTYDASAVSSSGIAGDFVLRVNAIAINGGVMAGMNSDPLTDNDYASIDYTWQNPYSSLGNIFESGALISTPGGSAYHWIWRLGTTLYYGRGADLATAQAVPDRTVAGATATLYFDSSLNDIGDEVEVLFYDTAGAISGASSVSFAPTATLTGNGALSGSSSIIFSPAATLTGKGALAGSSSVVFSPASTLTGTGALTGSSSLTFSPVATIKGLAPVTGTAALTFAPSGTITGKGALAGSSSVTFSPTGTLGTAGSVSSITGTSSISFSAAGNIRGLAPVSGSAAFVLTLAGSLTGKGALVGNSSLAFTSTSSPTAFRVWTDAVPEPDDFTETAPNTGTWTVTTPNTGTWG